MRNVLKTEHGTALYKQRQHLIETLFGSIKHNRGLGRFHRRGRAAVRTEWRLITATHNLLKLHKHQLATAAARRPPPGRPVDTRAPSTGFSLHQLTTGADGLMRQPPTNSAQCPRRLLLARSRPRQQPVCQASMRGSAATWASRAT
jgi:hypothetical protein